MSGRGTEKMAEESWICWYEDWGLHRVTNFPSTPPVPTYFIPNPVICCKFSPNPNHTRVFCPQPTVSWIPNPMWTPQFIILTFTPTLFQTHVHSSSVSVFYLCSPSETMFIKSFYDLMHVTWHERKQIGLSALQCSCTRSVSTQTHGVSTTLQPKPHEVTVTLHPTCRVRILQGPKPSDTRGYPTPSPNPLQAATRHQWGRYVRTVQPLSKICSNEFTSSFYRS